MPLLDLTLPKIVMALGVRKKKFQYGGLKIIKASKIPLQDKCKILLNHYLQLLCKIAVCISLKPAATFLLILIDVGCFIVLEVWSFALFFYLIECT